jgi:hypothetical protein
VKNKEMIKKEHVWLACIALGPITAYLAVYNTTYSLLAMALIVIGLKGVLVDIM